MNISQKLTVFFVLLAVFVHAEPLIHLKKIEFISDRNPVNQQQFTFDRQEYVISKYDIKDYLLCSLYKEDHQCYAFTIKKIDQEPFLVLIDSELFWGNSNSLKPLSLEVYYLQPHIADALIVEFVKTALKAAGVSYDVLQIKEDPLEIDFILRAVNPRIHWILLQRQTFAEKIGGKYLNFEKIDWKQFGVRYVYQYLGSKNYYIFIKCKKWLANYVTIDGLYQSFKNFPESENSQRFLKLLEKCSTKKLSNKPFLLSNFYQQNLQTDLAGELFQDFLANYQNPLLFEIIENMFENELDKNNLLHKMVACHVLFNAKTILENNQDELQKNLAAADQNFWQVVEKVDFNQSFKKIIDTQFASLEKNKNLPLEKKLFANLSSQQIQQLLYQEMFFLLNNGDAKQTIHKIKASLACLDLEQLADFQFDMWLDHLNQLLNLDFAWVDYFVKGVCKKEWAHNLLGSDELDGSMFLKWFFYSFYINFYSDLFVPFKSSWF